MALTKYHIVNSKEAAALCALLSGTPISTNYHALSEKNKFHLQRLKTRLESDHGADIPAELQGVSDLQVCESCYNDGREKECRVHDARKAVRRLRALVKKAEPPP